MQALIDGDILLYEIGFAAEASWKYQGEEGTPPFELALASLEGRIAEIQIKAETVGEPFFFFSSSKNFRFDIAKTQPYKERPGQKPFHYYNLKAYIKSEFKCQEVEGYEADDLIAIVMTKHPNKYICCTRDKDLRQIPGWHFGWELGNQPQFGPILIDSFGWIELQQGKTKKIVGGGEKFFYSQLLTGDTVDTIPGVPGLGAVGAFKMLEPCLTIQECLEVCKEAYKRSYGLYWNEVMLEQGQLLRMVREIHAGKPVLWEFDYV